MLKPSKLTFGSMTSMYCFDFRLMMEHNSQIVCPPHTFHTGLALITSSGRMRQIITPLPKVTEPETSTNLNQPGPSGPTSGPVNMDIAVPYPPARRRSTPIPRRRSLKAYRQRPIRTSSQPASKPNAITGESFTNSVTPEFITPIFDPSAVLNFGSSVSQSESSSPGPSTNYSFATQETIVPGSLNVTPQLSAPSSDESTYIDFFLREVPTLLPFTELFPTVCHDIWALSLTHIPLSQAILAISSYLSDRRADLPPVTGLSYLENTLSRISEAISLGIVDEALIASVFLLALLSTLSADYKSSRRHLQGLSQLIQVYEQRLTTLTVPSGTSTNRIDNYALVMILWRMAIRIEYHIAFYNHGQGPPIFPINDTSQERTHIEWISKSISKFIPNGVNWALASFALDDLMNRAGHLSCKLNENGAGMMDRSFQIHELIDEHQSWKRRPIVNQSMIECLSPPPDTTINPNMMHSTAPTFLHYPPARIHNHLFATLLIRHFMIGIYLSLIADPRPGPISPARFQTAVDICRYFVTLYGDPPLLRNDTVLRPVDNCMAIITAGFTFPEDAYPREFEYCTRTLAVIAQQTGFSSLMDVVEILKATHRNQVGDADWAKEFQLKIELPSPGLRWDVPPNSLATDLNSFTKLVH
jgi:hypothetical protein